ncbi:helix-turn-helix domain-containing protein [Streptomyces sp. NPDC058391]|uniref:helix-turn-helix domain-containing protein n=1 Tax=Streptomyces sp. NPDC058391 TaxID=3346476 RepID=UPI003646E8B1
MATTEAEAFAAVLRELKDRSGRSYGVLAGKLHVSTSTLHRYCNGDAVPAEFAPVERLGRLCGATAEELVALHRRWILADEARRRGRSAESAEPEPVPAVEPAVEVPAVEEPAVAPAVEMPAVEEPAVAESTAPRAKRLRLVLAAVAVVAVAVPAIAIGSRAALASKDDSVAAVVSNPPGKDAGESTPPSGARGEESPSASPSVSPSGSVSPPASSGVSRAPSAGHTSGGGAAGDAVPVVVSTRPYAWEDPCSQHYLINRPATQVPPPPTEQDASSWVGALGGVASGGQFIELTAQGTGSDTVVLQALRVHIVRSGAPLAWTDYAMGVGCGGNVSTKSFDVDLDAGRPSSVPRSGQRDFPYKVSEQDPEVLYIHARSMARDVSWYLELEWSSGDRSGTLRVDDRGKPFRTSGSRGRPAYDYPPGGTEWQTAATG